MASTDHRPPAIDRRAKIVATLGPASAGEEMLGRLLAAGVDAARLNLSHGDHDDHRRMIRTLRALAAEQGRFIPIIADLMGPRYRLGKIPGGSRTLRAGTVVRLGRPDQDVDLPLEEPKVLSYLCDGERLLIDNGLVELRVLRDTGHAVEAEVVSGGPVATRKGLNLPDTPLPFIITDKDRADVAFAVAEGVDYLAVSFVGGPKDLEAVRRVVKKAGGVLPLIAKLERARVTGQLEETVAAADAVMVARGDLGVEVPIHQVPVLQKRIVAIGRALGKPVIVATQMLESMMAHPRPTRAEATDVANAVFDGADALMLSGETAAGRYPLEAVTTMAEIIRTAEAYRVPGGPRELLAGDSPPPPLAPGAVEQLRLNPERDVHLEIPDTIAAAAVFAARRLDVRHVVAFSQGGFTARMIARYRPRPPIVVFTNDPCIARRAQLVWGVHPLLMEDEVGHHDEVVSVVDQLLLERGLADPGDRLIVLMGDPIAERPLTNLLRIHRVRGRG
ncbi:MAG: pyruvate kinase [Acidobacteria bacterium]|nr:MAG: pyruvate kinase [Acidobacteriota bacterium]